MVAPAQGPDTVHALEPADADALAYTMPEFGLRMPYRPTDFTQVNHAINRSMVSRALTLLEVQPTDRVADLFCGLGNFTLPLATQGREAVGVEGSKMLTDRAFEAAARHGLAASTSFATLNLFEVDVEWLRGLGYFDRMLIDPPREGAQAVAQALSLLAAEERPRRIVYVSCNPATLARDAAIMVHEGGYVLKSAGVINMFPTRVTSNPSPCSNRWTPRACASAAARPRKAEAARLAAEHPRRRLRRRGSIPLAGLPGSGSRVARRHGSSAPGA